MSWIKGNLITADKLNLENNKVTYTLSIGNNTTATRTKLCYIHKPSSPNQVIAHCWFHSLDGWFGNASNHYIKMWASNSSGAELSLIINKSWTSYQNRLTFDIKGSSFPSSGWYKLYIRQADEWGGEQITMQIKASPMCAISGHQIVKYASPSLGGNVIHDNTELSAKNLNLHNISTV